VVLDHKLVQLFFIQTEQEHNQKKILYSFIVITKTIFFTTMPVLLTKLSFVRVTPLNKKQRNIFTFKGIFIFHKNMILGKIFKFSMTLYIDLVEN
jgi:hypothetical protein